MSFSAFSRSGPPCPRYAQGIAPPEEGKDLPIPQTPPPRHARDHRAVFPPALGLPRPGARRAGSVPPALSEKSAFSSDPMKGTCFGVSRRTRLGRPSPPCDRPMRVALAGFPSPRPDFEGGETRACFVCPLRPAPPRSESGEEPRGAKERVVKPACGAVPEPGMLLRPWSGKRTKGPASCARPSAAGPPSPHRSPRVLRARLGARSRAGREGLGGGGLPGPTRPPSVPAASGPSRPSPSLPFPRPRPRRARRVRVSLVRRAVWSRLAPPRSPAAFPRSGSSGDPSLLGAGDPVLALRARDLSLGRGLWRNGGRSSPARRRTRRGPPPPEVLRRRRARLSRRWVCASGERGEALGAFRGTREGKRLSGRPSSALSTVGPSAEVRLGTLPAPSSSGKGVRVSRVGNRHPHRVGCPAVRYPPARACRSPPVWRRGLRSMTLPVPEVRPSRASRCRRGVPPHVPRGEDRPRRRRLPLPLPPLPPRFGARARPGSCAGSRSPPPPRLARGRPPSASPAKPVGAVVVRPPRRFPVSPDPARRVGAHPVLPGVAPRCRACVYGGARRGPTPALEPTPAAVGLDPRRGR